jgi:hypothetical protein
MAAIVSSSRSSLSSLPISRADSNNSRNSRPPLATMVAMVVHHGTLMGVAMMVTALSVNSAALLVTLHHAITSVLIVSSWVLAMMAPTWRVKSPWPPKDVLLLRLLILHGTWTLEPWIISLVNSTGST